MYGLPIHLLLAATLGLAAALPSAALYQSILCAGLNDSSGSPAAAALPTAISVAS